MFLRVVVLLQVICAFPQIIATNLSSNSLSPTTQLGASATATTTVELPSSAFQSATVSPSTASSQQPKASTSTSNVNSLLDQANKILEELQKKAGPASANVKECDGIDWYVDNKCTDKQTCEAYIENYSTQMKCIAKKPANVSSFNIADNLELAGIKIAEDLMNKVKNGAPNNATSNFVKDKFVIISGVVDVNYINTTKDEFLQIPNYSDPSFLTAKWETLRDSIAIPIMELKKRAAPYWPYMVAVQPHLVQDKPLTVTEIETDYNELIKDSDVTDLYLDGNELKSRKKPQNVYINTNVLSFSFNKVMKDLIDPVLITLRHKKVDTLENPSCVFWDTSSKIWSKQGCEVKESNSTHTICSCNHLSMFAVAMKEKNVEDLSKRETLVTVAIVFGSISMILLIAAAVCIFVVGYHSVDNMKIALNIDLSLILCHLFFFVGLSNEASKYLATPATCKAVAPFVHMFELAALSFLLMEGLHYRSLFKTVFNKRNTRTFYIYASLGWGIPVAFGSAVAGYTYQHHGSPFRNEFCWMSVYGADAWYFGAPVLILVLLNLIVRATVLKGVMSWKGDSDDVTIERTKMRLITAMILLPVILLTWLLGVLATNYSEDKTYHYFFVIFHALQGILVFVFYCARNTEMWDWYKEKKTKEMEEKNAVYQFQYVP